MVYLIFITLIYCILYCTIIILTLDGANRHQILLSFTKMKFKVLLWSIILSLKTQL